MEYTTHDLECLATYYLVEDTGSFEDIIYINALNKVSVNPDYRRGEELRTVWEKEHPLDLPKELQDNPTLIARSYLALIAQELDTSRISES
jgi:hypothetical protein|tara:strand:- start:3257 stop:3529 length:273 start_codon:yes stop_codon:yes gene_type:complete